MNKNTPRQNELKDSLNVEQKLNSKFVCLHNAYYVRPAFV